MTTGPIKRRQRVSRFTTASFTPTSEMKRSALTGAHGVCHVNARLVDRRAWGRDLRHQRIAERRAG